MGILGSLVSFASPFLFPVGEYNAAPPTITDGQQGPFQIDPNGNLKVNLAAGGSTGAQGAPNTAANGWPVKLTDGTTVVDAKAASTAAAFADKAAVVDVRPGGVFPVGANPGDATTNTTTTTKIQAWLSGYNGTTWDRVRTGLSGVQTSLTGVLSSMAFAQYVTAPPSPANGNVVPLQADSAGNLKGSEQGGGAFPAAAASADAVANPTVSKLGAFNASYNGTTWDRVRGGLSGVQTVLTGLLNTIGMAQYNTAAPTPANGNVVPLQSDASGNLKGVEQFAPAAEDNTNGVFATMVKPLSSATYAPSLSTNFGAAATANVKATPGNLLSIYAHNTNAAIRYIQVHNTATTPGGAAVPILSFLVPATGTVVIDRRMLSEAGIRFSTGIALGMSTTEGTYTAATAGESFWHATYI